MGKLDMLLDFLIIFSGCAGAIGAIVSHCTPVLPLTIGGIFIACLGILKLVVDIIRRNMV